MTPKSYLFSIVLIAFSLLPAAAIQTAWGLEDDLSITEKDFEKWGNSQIVLTGKLDRAIAGPVGLSSPPVRNYRLFVTVEDVLRGELGSDHSDLPYGEAEKKEVETKPLILSYSVRQDAIPEFPVGDEVIISARSSRGQTQALSVTESSDELMKKVRSIIAIPLGWSIKEGQPVSPWAKLGKKAWPEDSKGTPPRICAETGRPILLLGKHIEMSVAKVPPEKNIKWTNPDGDGEYRITVTNTNDMALQVPALIKVDDKILWNECLLIRCQGKVYTMPGSHGVSQSVKFAELQPGESVSTVVNALSLEGPDWPRGGYRIEFQFCLGESSSVQSFYYLSKHHDKVREGLNK